MNKKLVLLLILIHCYQASTTVEDCSYFEILKQQECINLGSSTGHLCKYVDNQCTETYTECSNYYYTQNSFNSKICENIQPSNIYKKCVVKDISGSKSCEEADKNCEDLSTEYDCINYNIGEDKRCVFIDSKCEEHFNSCNGLGADKCNKNIPSSNNQKCSLDGSNCKSEDRQCIDYIEYSDKNGGYKSCHLLKSTSPKKCFYNSNENKCEEIYEKCEDTNDETTCKTIKPLNSGQFDSYKKCEYNEGCIPVSRVCDDYKREDDPENLCSLLSTKGDSTIKRCVLDGEICKEVYKNCELYNNNVEDKDKNKIDCESITPIYDTSAENSLNYKCVYDQSTKTCSRKIVKCEEYKGQDANYCRSLSTNDNSLYKCIFVDNKCTEEYKSCEKYTDWDKKTCESIKLDNEPFKRCFLENDRNCKTKPKLCSEYDGEDEEECSFHRASDSRKKCIIENRKCIEKLMPETYYHCSDYRGTDKEFCESIQPYDYMNPSNPDHASRCVYGNNGCENLLLNCGDLKTESECDEITPTNGITMCVFKGNKCVDQYISCQKYYDSENVIEEQTCKSIKVQSTYQTRKCVYEPATGGTGLKALCTEINRECRDFEVEFIKSQCTELQLTDQTKKCTFSNNVCSTVPKTCIDLNNFSGATDEICEAAQTSSSDKICKLNYNKNGCKEVNKPKSSKKKDNGGKLSFNKIILILLCFIF